MRFLLAVFTFTLGDLEMSNECRKINSLPAEAQ